MRPVIAFDMNGTLLDTAALDPLFDAAFRAANIRRGTGGIASVTCFGCTFAEAGARAIRPATRYSRPTSADRHSSTEYC